MKRYFPKEIEPKWQKIWKEQNLYKFDLKSSKNKYYNLVEFPYPSGDLHLGHWFTFAPADAFARFKRMQGFSVLFPNGFDAFGLPAENAAIKRQIHPKDWTLSNIKNMTEQFLAIGTMIDWNHTVITCLPEYYKWNQWIFLKMLEKGVAFKGKAMSNWCPLDQTVLANEHVEAGKCWRCGTEVVQKEVEQWFLKITNYADDLLWKEDSKVNWPKAVREGQNNWIGKSEGLILDFGGVEVFTTRPETADGATFVVLSPEMGEKFKIAKSEEVKVKKYLEIAKKKTEMERKEEKEKTGVFTGSYVLNPVTGREIPVWIADYVLSSYGTGAIMAVPGEDERDKKFAEKFDLPIVKSKLNAKPQGKKMVNYHLRDWSVSRQRYWGTPVPIIHCDKCGDVPVPYEDLPVELPYEVDYAPKGKAPLATAKEWMNVSCPKCKGKAQRDPETLDTFFDSSWYLWRYVSPEYDKAPFDKTLTNKLMPVDVYFGGAEHTLGHTLYARFFTKFFKDIGLTNLDEFAEKRVQHGVILGPDGFRMSKSRGNVVNPDELVSEYGADTVRTYLCFMMPYEATAPFSQDAISGIYRFLKRIWDLQGKIGEAKLSDKDLLEMNKAVKKVTEDLEHFRFNTAISAIMTWLNFLARKNSISITEYETLLRLIAPFAPHISEELYQTINSKREVTSIHLEDWPKFDQKYLKEEKINIVVQVNGRVRATIEINSNDIKDEARVKELAQDHENVKKYLNTSTPTKIIYVEGKIISFVS